MGTQSFTPPAFNSKAFHCPTCNVYANQIWHSIFKGGENNSLRGESSLKLAECAHCLNYTLWKEQKIIYPESNMAPLPDSDLPKEMVDDYNEAALIISHSPRGATAILRLCIQNCVNI